MGAILLLAEQSPAPKQLLEAKPSDCAACHETKSPLPKDHPPTAALSLKGCQDCHAKGSPTTLKGKLPLSHVHQLSGAACSKCHADPKQPEPVAFAECLTCHSAENVSAATAEIKPTDPHSSPHFGKSADCNLCHHQHEKSENYCSQCHNFKFDVP
jgi:hypothetical protein